MRVLEGAEEYWIINDGQYARADKLELARHGLTVNDFQHMVLQAQDRQVVTPRPPYHVTLAISTRCDLRCPYCFQQTLGGDETPQRIAASDLDQRSTLEGIGAFVSTRMEAAGAAQVDLLLYGGEPLLRPKACLDALITFQGLGLRQCDMTTNGVGIRRALFSELVDAGLTDTQVSLDGWRADHDVTRSSKGGRPTYDRIIKNIESCNDLGIRWQFRINMTPQNLPALGDAIHDLASVTKSGTAQIMLAPVLGLSGIFDGTVEANAELAQRVVSLYEEALSSGLGIVMPGETRVCVDCGSLRGETGAVIAPDGQLYSCWETIGRPDYSVGDVWSGYTSNDSMLNSRWVHCGTLTDGGHGTGNDRYEETVAVGLLNLLRQAGALGANAAA